MKKLLGIILSVALVLSMSVPALADWWSEPDGIPYPVEGGSIYIDEDTKTVIGADETVTSAVIPDSVTSIGAFAFVGCSDLTGVTIPDSVTSIGEYAFNYCTGLTGVTIPGSVTSIGEYAFGDCEKLESITVDSGNTSYASKDGVLFTADGKVLHTYPEGKPGEAYRIPDGVTSIGNEAFNGCSDLTSVTIPGSVTSIGSRAFRACTSLTSVTILDGVTSIGDAAFNACTSLTDVTIPGSVTSIGSGAFDSCTSLTSVTIPGSVTSIGIEAFDSCTSLTSVTILDGVTSIGLAAFSSCTSLTDVTIPGSITSIESWAFSFCSALTGVTIPASVTSIGNGAFSSCTGLTSVTIHDGVTSIGDNAFNYCTGLTSVTIPASVTSIGEDAFGFCFGLTSVTIPASVTSIGVSAFECCDSLTDIYFGGSAAQWEAVSSTAFGYDFFNNDGYLETSATVHYNSAVPTDTAAPASFTDAKPGGAYTNAVNWATENKFADPVSSAAFGTADPCPRWEVVSIIWKAMDSPEPETTENPFTDVSESDPYYKAILWAYENGITTGISDTEFGVNATVKRGDAMTFIWRAASKPASDAENPFADVVAGKYYEAPVLWAVENGITNGTDATHFAPENSVTRGQMVTFLYRWLVENA